MFAGGAELVGLNRSSAGTMSQYRCEDETVLGLMHQVDRDIYGMSILWESPDTRDDRA